METNMTMASDYRRLHDWWIVRIIERDDVERLECALLAMEDLLSIAARKKMAFTALLQSCNQKAPRCFDRLAEVAANARMSRSVPALHAAVQLQNESAAKHLAKHSRKNEIAAIAADGFLWAVHQNDLDLLDIFLPYVDVANDTYDGGQTALMVAARLKGNDVFARLISCSNRELRDRHGFNALMHAIAGCNEKSLATLLCDASKMEITGKVAGGLSAIEFAERVQGPRIQFGLSPDVKLFKPHDMVLARLNAIEIGEEIDVVRSGRGGDCSASAARGARRL